MALGTIARLAVSIEAQTAKFTQGIEKVEYQLIRLEQRQRKAAQGIARGMTAIGAAIGTVGLASFINGVNQAADSLAGLENAVTSATGNVAQSRKELEFVRQTADKLGLNFQVLAGQYAKIANSARDTKAEGEGQRKIFESIATAARVMRLENEAVTGAFRAVEQMMAKGKVQAEELRGQLAERIPAATRIMASALGVTTQKLDEMLKAGEVMADEALPKFANELIKRFGGQTVGAVNTLQAQVEILKNSFFDFQLAVSDITLEPTIELTKALSAMFKWLAENIELVRSVALVFASLMAAKVVSVLISVLGASLSAGGGIRTFFATMSKSPVVLATVAAALLQLVDYLYRVENAFPEADRAIKDTTDSLGAVTELMRDFRATGSADVQEIATLFKGISVQIAENAKQQQALNAEMAASEGIYNNLFGRMDSLKTRLNSLETAQQANTRAASLLAGVLQQIAPEKFGAMEDLVDSVGDLSFSLESISEVGRRARIALLEFGVITEDVAKINEDADKNAAKLIKTLEEQIATLGEGSDATLAYKIATLEAEGANEDLIMRLKELRSQLLIKQDFIDANEAIDQFIEANREAAESAGKTAEQLLVLHAAKLAETATTPTLIGQIWASVTARLAAEKAAEAEKNAIEALSGAKAKEATYDVSASVEKADELIEALQQELMLLGATNAERRLAMELRALDGGYTEKQRIQIEALTRAIDIKTKSIEDSADATKKLGKEYKTLEELGLEAAKRLDAAFVDMWENFLREGKFSLDGIKDLFYRTLAEMIQAAIRNQIVLQFTGNASGGGGVVQSLFGGGEGGGGMLGSLAGAAGDWVMGLFGGGAAVPAGSFAASNPIAQLMAGEASFGPGGVTGLSGGTAGSTGGTFFGNGSLFGATNAGGATMSGIMSSAGIGAMIGSVLSAIPLSVENGTYTPIDLLGLDTSNPTVQRYSETFSQIGAIAGSIVGSFIPVIGTALGGLLGGLDGRVQGAIWGSILDREMESHILFGSSNIANRENPGGYDQGFETAFGEVLVRSGRGDFRTEMQETVVNSMQGFLEALGQITTESQQQAIQQMLEGQTLELNEGNLKDGQWFKDFVDQVTGTFSEDIQAYVAANSDDISSSVEALFEGIGLERAIEAGLVEGFSLEDIAAMLGGFQQEGEYLTDTLVRVAAQTDLVRASFDQFGVELGAFSTETAQFSEDLIEALGGLDAAAGIMQRVFLGMYTEAERQDMAVNAMRPILDQQFEAFGLNADDFLTSTGLQDFRAVFEELLPTLSAEDAAALYEAADSFIVFFDAMQQMGRIDAAELPDAAAIEQNAGALADLMSAVRRENLALTNTEYANALSEVRRQTEEMILQATELGATEAELAEIRALGEARAAAIADELVQFMDEIRAASDALGRSEVANEIAAITARMEEQMATARALGASVADLAEVQALAAREIGQLMRGVENDIRAGADALLGGAAQSERDSEISRLEAELQTLNQTADRQARLAEESYNAALEYYQAQQENADNLRDWINGTLLNEAVTTLTPAERLEEAQRQFDEVFQAALAGDADAFAEFPNISNELLEIARFMFASGADYQDIFNGVLDKARMLEQIARETAPPEPIDRPYIDSRVAEITSRLETLNDTTEAVGRSADTANLETLLTNLTDWAAQAGVDFQAALDVFGIDEAELANLINAEFQNINFGTIDPVVLQNAISSLLTLENGKELLEGHVRDLLTLREGDAGVEMLLGHLFSLDDPSQGVAALLDGIFAVADPDRPKALINAIFGGADQAFVQARVSELLSLPNGDQSLMSIVNALFTLPPGDDVEAAIESLFAAMPLDAAQAMLTQLVNNLGLDGVTALFERFGIDLPPHMQAFLDQLERAAKYMQNVVPITGDGTIPVDPSGGGGVFDPNLNNFSGGLTATGEFSDLAAAQRRGVTAEVPSGSASGNTETLLREILRELQLQNQTRRVA